MDEEGEGMGKGKDQNGRESEAHAQEEACGGIFPGPCL